VYKIATVISTEARAFINAGFAGLDFWTPNVMYPGVYRLLLDVEPRGRLGLSWLGRQAVVLD